MTDSKRHFVYKVSNNLNGKFYIGIHSTIGDFLNSDYYGSGTSIIKAVKEYGKHNFTREVLFECLTRLNAIKIEKKLVTKELITNKQCYNLTVGGHAPPINQKEIKSIDKYGNIIFYESIKKASIITGVHPSNISEAVNGQRKSAGKFCWAYSSNKIKFYNTSIKKNIINCCSVDSNNITTYYVSAADAGKKTGISSKHIYECMNNTRKSAGGLSWYRASDAVKKFNPPGCFVSYTSIFNGLTKVYNTLTEASIATGVSKSAICQAAKYSRKAGGYKWIKTQGVNNNAN